MGSSKDQVVERLDFVRTCLARGYYDHEILRLCEGQACFLVARGTRRAEDDGDRELKPMNRGSIRKHYLYKVRKQLREHAHDPTVELQLAYERLLSAFRVSAQQEGGPDNLGMVRAQREMNRMLGLRRREMPIQPVDGTLLDQQLKAMEATMGEVDGETE